MARIARGPSHNSRSVMTLDFDVYIHTAPLTVSPEGGLECVRVPMILGRETGVWHIDCLDMAALHNLLPHSTRSERGISLDPVMVKAAGVIANKGIDPFRVRGWSLYFCDGVRRRSWAALGLP
jgi:hypothetical protein